MEINEQYLKEATAKYELSKQQLLAQVNAMDGALHVLRETLNDLTKEEENGTTEN